MQADTMHMRTYQLIRAQPVTIRGSQGYVMARDEPQMKFSLSSINSVTGPQETLARPIMHISESFQGSSLCEIHGGVANDTKRSTGVPGLLGSPFLYFFHPVQEYRRAILKEQSIGRERYL